MLKTALAIGQTSPEKDIGCFANFPFDNLGGKDTIEILGEIRDWGEWYGHFESIYFWKKNDTIIAELKTNQTEDSFFFQNQEIIKVVIPFERTTIVDSKGELRISAYLEDFAYLRDDKEFSSYRCIHSISINGWVYTKTNGSGGWNSFMKLKKRLFAL